MNKNEALDLALEALGLYQASGFGNSTDFNKQHEAFYKAQTAIIAINQARALDKMAENARELGLDYEPAPVQPVAWLYPEGLEALKAGKCWTAYGTKQDDNCNISVYLNAAVAQKVEPVKTECDGFDSHPAAPVQEPVGKCKDATMQSLKDLWRSVCDEVGKKAFAQPAPIPENFIDALKFDVAMRDAAPVRPTKDVEISNMGKPFTVKAYTTPPAQPATEESSATQPAQRQWVGLTEDEIDEIFNNWPKYHLDHCEFAQVVQAKVFEKNGAIAVVIPDALNPKEENPAYAAGWNDCRAEMLGGVKP